MEKATENPPPAKTEGPRRFSLMISTGEISGEKQIVKSLAKLRQRGFDLDAYGIGDRLLAAENVKILASHRNLSVVGILEVLRRLPYVIYCLFRFGGILRKKRPDLLITVDFAGFNLRLAKRAKKAGIRTLHVVSPQIWASRPRRKKTIVRVIDVMAVLFPFEVDLYRGSKMRVQCIGHPAAEEIYHLRSGRDEARSALGLRPETLVFGLFPGSRPQEIEQHMPVILETQRLLRQRHEDRAEFVIPLASKNLKPLLQKHLSRSDPIRLTDNAPRLMHAADACLLASGTVTLEAAIVGVPMAMFYIMRPLSYWVARRMTLTKHYSLVNILADSEVIREFLQDAAQPHALSRELTRLATDGPYREEMKKHLSSLRKDFQGNSSEALADLIEELLLSSSSQSATAPPAPTANRFLH